MPPSLSLGLPAIDERPASGLVEVAALPAPLRLLAATRTGVTVSLARCRLLATTFDPCLTSTSASIVGGGREPTLSGSLWRYGTTVARKAPSPIGLAT